MAYFFVRLNAHRPDFPSNLTAEEGAVMQRHAAFLREQLAAGALVVAGPVLDPGGVFGMGVFEAESLDALRAIVERDPASALGRYDVHAMASAVARSR